MTMFDIINEALNNEFIGGDWYIIEDEAGGVISELDINFRVCPRFEEPVVVINGEDCILDFEDREAWQAAILEAIDANPLNVVDFYYWK